MHGQISRDEIRSAIADKLCAHFGVSPDVATDDQVFQASAMVIREIMSRFPRIPDGPKRKSIICRWSSSWAAA